MGKRISTGSRQRRRVAGTTLIELLSAIVVVSIGLLGISNLQAKALKSSQDSFFVSQATFLLDDIAERMRANHSDGNPASGNYDFVNAMSDFTDLTGAQQAQDCVDAVCTPAQVATYDVAQWLQTMTVGNRALPSSKAKITWNARIATVTIRWKSAYSEDGNCDATGDLNGAPQDYRCLTTLVTLP